MDISRAARTRIRPGSWFADPDLALAALAQARDLLLRSPDMALELRRSSPKLLAELAQQVAELARAEIEREL